MSLDAALEELVSSFNELNPPEVAELDSEPSPLEFMRYVARNAPFVVRGGASSWKAVQKWTPSYLKAALTGQTVNVAVTPFGNADSPVSLPSHATPVLAKPHEEAQPFDEFLDYLIRQETDTSFPPNAEVRYAQTQNDNLRHEYVTLLPDAQKDVPFARIALQRPPDAVNLWIGNSRSISAAHRDNYENLYVQVSGRKHFLLLPPLCQPCMNEKPLPPATYVRQGQALALIVDQDSDPVPFPTWDPDEPNRNAASTSHLAQPFRITLDPGDMLYLPALWYHKVKQSCNASGDGVVVAINYWYDMELRSTFFPLASFLRTLSVRPEG